MELAAGQIVMSRKGRDCERFYVVMGQRGDRMLLANGGKWTLAAPKPKNIRHIQPTAKVLLPEQYSTDETLRAALAAYETTRGPGKEDR